MTPRPKPIDRSRRTSAIPDVQVIDVPFIGHLAHHDCATGAAWSPP